MPLAYILCCLGVIIGVSLIIIGLSKPGENILSRLFERFCKKYFSAPFLFLAVFLMFSTVAWAGERSNILSEKELSVIQSVADKTFPQGTKIFMVVDQEFFERFTIIKFIREDDKVSLRLLVKPHRVLILDAESPKIGEKVGKKIVESIQRILDESPRLALGNILD